MSKYNYQLQKYYEEIVHEIKKGESLRYLSKKYDIDYFTFYDKIRKECPEIMSMKKGSISPAQKERYSKPHKKEIDVSQIHKMYVEDRMSAMAISKIFGVCQNTILKTLRENDIQKNNQSVYWNDERREHHKKLCHDGVIGIHSQGDGAYRFTGIERQFAAWCERNEIEYTRQYQITTGKHRYDFWINGTSLLVELDGDYWHSNEEQQKKDLAHVAEAEESGLTVVRFSDTMIYETKEKCFDKILALI